MYPYVDSILLSDFQPQLRLFLQDPVLKRPGVLWLSFLEWQTTRTLSVQGTVIA